MRCLSGLLRFGGKSVLANVLHKGWLFAILAFSGHDEMKESFFQYNVRELMHTLGETWRSLADLFNALRSPPANLVLQQKRLLRTRREQRPSCLKTNTVRMTKHISMVKPVAS